MRNVYPYGVNNGIENKNQCKSGKECEDLIGKAFPSLPHVIIMHAIKTGKVKIV